MSKIIEPHHPGRVDLPKFKAQYEVTKPIYLETAAKLPTTADNQGAILSGTTFRTSDKERVKESLGHDQLVHDVGQIQTYLDANTGARIRVFSGIGDGQGTHTHEEYDKFVTEQASKTIDFIASKMREYDDPDKLYNAIPNIINQVAENTPQANELAKKLYTPEEENIDQAFLAMIEAEAEDQDSEAKTRSTVKPLSNLSTEEQNKIIEADKRLFEEKNRFIKQKRNLIIDRMDRDYRSKIPVGLDEKPQTTLSVFQTFLDKNGKNTVVGLNIGDSMVVAWNPFTQTFRTLGKAAVQKGSGMPLAFPTSRDSAVEFRFKEAIEEGEVVFALSDGITDHLKKKLPHETTEKYILEELDPKEMRSILSNVDPFAPPQDFMKALANASIEHAEKVREESISNNQVIHELEKVEKEEAELRSSLSEMQVISQLHQMITGDKTNRTFSVERDNFLNANSPEKLKESYNTFIKKVRDVQLKPRAEVKELKKAVEKAGKKVSANLKQNLERTVEKLKNLDKLEDDLINVFNHFKRVNEAESKSKRPFKTLNKHYQDYFDHNTGQGLKVKADTKALQNKINALNEEFKSIQEKKQHCMKLGNIHSKKDGSLTSSIGDDIIISASRVPILAQEHLRIALNQVRNSVHLDNQLNLAVDSLLNHPGLRRKSTQADLRNQERAIEGIFNLLKNDHVSTMDATGEVPRYVQKNILDLQKKFIGKLADRKISILASKNQALHALEKNTWYSRLPTFFKVVVNILPIPLLPAAWQAIKAWNNAGIVAKNKLEMREIRSQANYKVHLLELAERKEGQSSVKPKKMRRGENKAEIEEQPMAKKKSTANQPYSGILAQFSKHSEQVLEDRATESAESDKQEGPKQDDPGKKTKKTKRSKHK